MQELSYRWREDFDNHSINLLHAEAFDHQPLGDDWWGQVNRFSLGWVCAREGAGLVGFTNVAWDGGVHAFILDTMVLKSHRRMGVARRMIEVCVAGTRRARCEWLHVDFGKDLATFYFDACGFTSTPAGLIRL